MPQVLRKTLARQAYRLAFVATVAVVSALSFAQSADTALGRRIFEDGRGRDGRYIIGRVADGAVPMQGAVVACANCHGANGSGGGEAWIDAPDIRGFALSKPYGARRAGGEARPPYDRASFARALRTGIAPDGVGLDPAMPRFDLADDELDALLAHLNALSDRAHAQRERPALVVLMPQAAPPPAERLLQRLQNCPTAPAANESARPLPALRVLRYDTFDAISPQLDAMARDGSAAALFAPYLIGAEDAFARSGVGTRLPMVLPMAMRNIGDDARVLFGLPDLRAQAMALIEAPASPQANRLTLVVDPVLAQRDALSRSLRDAAEAVGWRVKIVARFDEAFAEGGSDAVLALADITDAALPKTRTHSLRLWVPAAFIVPAQLNAWENSGAHVRIALPYPPTVGDDPRWIPPTDAWAAIGCELLARLPPLPAQSDGIDAWRDSLANQPELRLGDWLNIPATAGMNTATRAFVMEWQ